jgi:hypothetical protein
VSRSRQKFGTREWEQDIYLHVSNHGRVEGEILDEYESLMVDETLSPAFSYLARIILEDEVRHHQIFDDLAETMGNMATDGTAVSPIASNASPSVFSTWSAPICVN